MEADGDWLIGTAVLQCGLLTEYSLWMTVFQASGAQNDAMFKPNVLLECPP